MPVIFSQESILKHFMERRASIDINSERWRAIAIKNHEERQFSPTNINDLLLIKPEIWPSIADQTYFQHVSLAPESPYLTIDLGIIDRYIRTIKRGSEYSVENDLIGDLITHETRFKCTLLPTGVYEIVHLDVRA